MICATCKQHVDQAVHCDCFEVFCRDCFAGHHCGHEHLAQYTRCPDPGPTQHQATELAQAMFRLRPYQQECVDAILEALQ